MTLAAYTSDLTDIFLFESTTGVAAYGGGAAGLGAGADYAMEGTNAVDKQITAAEKGLMYDNGANFTIGADDHFFVWLIGATAGICDTRDNRGIVAAIGDSTSAFVKFHVNGKDTLPLGGGVAYPIRYDNTTLANRRTLVGAPSAAPSQIGGGLNTTGTVKGANLGVDGARIGTGYDVTGGTGADPVATLAGIAADDASTSEGVFQLSGGVYKLQGKLRVGSTGAACELTESGAFITITDTIHSLADFTEILLENAASILTLDSFTFLALGTNNRGRLEMITDTASLILTGGKFDGFGVSVLGSGAVLTTCSWVGADAITQNGATLAGGLVDSPTSTTALTMDDASKVSDMTFQGCDIAIDATAAIVADAVAIDGIQFSGNTTDITVNSANDITLNMLNGANATTCTNTGAGTCTIVNSVPLTITVQDEDGVAIENARVWIGRDDTKAELLNGGTNASGVVSDTFNYGASDVDVIGWARQMDLSGTDYVPTDITGTITTVGLTLTVTLKPL